MTHWPAHSPCIPRTFARWLWILCTRHILRRISAPYMRVAGGTTNERDGKHCANGACPYYAGLAQTFCLLVHIYLCLGRGCTHACAHVCSQSMWSSQSFKTMTPTSSACGSSLHALLSSLKQDGHLKYFMRSYVCNSHANARRAPSVPLQHSRQTGSTHGRRAWRQGTRHMILPLARGSCLRTMSRVCAPLLEPLC
jgi:hypothetical protein